MFSRLKNDAEVQDFRQAFYDITGKKYYRMIPVKIVSRNDSNASNNTSNNSSNWILQQDDNNQQQQHIQLHQNTFYRQSRSEHRRPRIPWGRSRSRDRERSSSPAWRSGSPWSEPRSPNIIVQSQFNENTLRDTGTQTIGEPLTLHDLKTTRDIKSYFHQSKVYYQGNRKVADATCQVVSQMSERDKMNTVSRTDSLFRRIRNLSAEVKQIQEIVDIRQSTRKAATAKQKSAEDDVDYIKSVDTMLNEKPGMYSQPTLYTSDMYGEGTVRVKVGDYRHNDNKNNTAVKSNGTVTQRYVKRNSATSATLSNGSYNSYIARAYQNDSPKVYPSSTPKAYQSAASKAFHSPAVFVTPPSPQLQTTTQTFHPLSPQTYIHGNYGRARSVVDGDFDYTDNVPIPRKTKSVGAGSLRLVPAKSLGHMTYAAHQSNGVRPGYAASVSGGVGATISHGNTRVYRPIERVYFPHGAPTEFRRRAHSAPRQGH